MIKVSFPDSNVKEFKKGTKVIDIAKSISEGLARKAISASYNSLIVELVLELVRFQGNPKSKSCYPLQKMKRNHKTICK